jgi:hypothetical protein
LHEIQVTFHLVQFEDDLVVLSLTEEQSWYLVGMKNPHAALLERLFVGSHEGLDDLIKAICSLDALVLTVRSQYAVNSISNIERLRKEIELRIRQNQSFPHKTRERLFHLEQKYRL